MLHCQIISQTHELFDRALNLYGEGRDKEWSLVGESSFHCGLDSGPNGHGSSKLCSSEL